MLYLILFNECLLHFFYFTCVTMMVFNVCVNDTKYYPSNGRQLLIAHVTLITTVHSKKCWVVLTQFWVKYGQTRNVGLKM